MTTMAHTGRRASFPDAHKQPTSSPHTPTKKRLDNIKESFTIWAPNPRKTHKMTTININEVFNALDARRVAAQAIVAQYTPAQVAEARRVALLYDRCATTSVKHAEDTARQLRELFGAPEKTMEFSPADYYTQDVFSRHGDAVLMTTTDTQDGFAPYDLTIIEGCPSSVHGLHYLVAHGGVVERTVFKSVAAAKTYAVDWYMGHREKVAV